MRIRFEDVSFDYATPGTALRPALRKISMEIGEREFIGVAGPSGAGKTTLMQLFTGLLRPTQGRVIIDGVELWSRSSLRRQVRRRIGLVFQFPENQLFADTVFEDVAFGPGHLGLTGHEVRQRVEEAMLRVGLSPDRYGHRSPFQLSEGEKRRVALAGVLAMRPEVLVLDEPTAALDSVGVTLVKRVLQDLHRSGVTILWISHDLDLLFESVQRFLLLREGTLAFDGAKALLRRNLEYLEEAGLGVPRLFHLLQRLQRLGWDVPVDVCSFEELRSWFARRKPARGRAILETESSSQACDT